MKIGIIGGGQLALMMIQSSPEHEYVVLEPKVNCSVREYAKLIIAPYEDKDALMQLFNQCDVITYEFENIPANALKIIETKLFPNSEILHISQNRLREKMMAQSLGIPTPQFFAISSIEDLKHAFSNISGKAVLKTTTGGYDGKGQIVIKNKEITDEIKAMINKTECILEAFVDYKYESSVVASRDKWGNFVFLPSTLNTHKDGILFTTSNLETISFKNQVKATKEIMEKFNVIGTLAVEFFETDFGFVFNELAPRPHNSGHWSIEGASVSQFRNHILAITNEKVILPENKKWTIMINLLGQDYIKAKERIEFNEKVIMHDYFKDEVKPGRKMAHICVVSDNKEECKELAKNVLKEIE